MSSHECPNCGRAVSRAGQLCGVCEQWIEDVATEQVRRGAAMHEEWKRQDRGGTGCVVAAFAFLTASVGLAAGLINVVA